VALVAGTVVAAASSGATQDAPAVDPQPLIAALREFIPRAMKLEGTPGLNLAIALDGRIVWEEGFGFADLDRRIPMTPATVTHSGSMGKTYTATAVMQLVERGVIGLYDPISRYITDVTIVNPLGEREITVADLLTHRSGLAANSAGSSFTVPPPLGERLRLAYASPSMESYEGTWSPRWTAKVGERLQYSNLGIATLGYLVQVANPERLPFSDYVQRHIMDPLGMRSSQYPPVQDEAHVRPELAARFSRGYATLGAMQIPTPAIYFGDFPAGTVVTVPGDHIRLLLAYLNEGSHNGYQLLKPETVKLMLTPRTKRAEGIDLGLVWNLRGVGKPDFDFSHSGAHMYGWTNDFRAYPAQKLALAVFTNHWPILHPRYHEHDLIARFVVAWLARAKAAKGPAPRAASWAWKTSYVMGLIMGEQLKPALGTEGTVTPGMLDSMAAGARPRDGERARSELWDEEAFRLGATDLLSVKPQSYAAIRAFLASDRLRILPEELELINRELGTTGTEVSR
jgi:CubicO group peptidase (beta-lactamase class C family)